MKELSIEQKAQRYDEAIAHAKKLLKTIGNATLGNLVLKNEFERMFPELAESEDDRIRKEMLQIAKESEDSFYMAMTPNKREKLIAWLEKQDEKPKKVSIWKHWKNGIAGNGDGKLIYLVKDGDNYSFSSCLGFECDYIELSELDKLLSEKQGEQNVLQTPTREMILAVWELGNIWKELTNGVCSTEYGTTLDYIQKHWHESEYYLKKQGEKNLADKVKSKFKVGDWIVYKDTVWKVCNIPLQNYYELLSINNEVIIRHFEGVDKTAHLWTIQDAKDGDVLVCKGDIKNSNGIKYERICLFKNLDNAFFTLTKTSNYVEEYGIDVNIDYPDNTVPATKEQKEILFMAMKEAGYEWDAEKKKLKKIADKVESKFHKGDWITDGISKCQIRFIDNAQYYYSENCILGSIESVDKRYHLWTIQDAKDGDILASKDGDDILIFRKLDGNKSFSSYYNIRRRKEIGWHNGWCYGSFIPATKEQCDVLMKAMTDAGYIFDFEKKELKKIEQNLTVTDEELSQAKHYAYNDALGKIEWRNGEPTFDDGWSAAIGFLKKRNTMPQTTWKPSDGQMEFLKKCIEAYNEVTFPTEVRVLSSLYNDLKKLME